MPIFRLADGRYHVIANFAVATLDEALAAAEEVGASAQAGGRMLLRAASDAANEVAPLELCSSIDANTQRHQRQPQMSGTTYATGWTRVRGQPGTP